MKVQYGESARDTAQKNTKTTTTLTLDSGLTKALHLRGINISNLVNEFLKGYANESQEEIDRKRIDEQIKDAEIKAIAANEDLKRLKAAKAKIEWDKGIPFNPFRKI